MLPAQPVLFAGGYPFRERKHPMPIGTVKFFNTEKGYGFIENEDGSGDSFVHITAVQSAGMQTLNKEQRLRSEENTSELQSLMRNSYAVFCLKQKKQTQNSR